MLLTLMGIGFGKLAGGTQTIIPNPITPPVAWYRFDETSGAVIDSANNYDGTVTNATRDGIRYSFDGVGDYVDLSSAVTAMKANTGGTINFFIRMSNAAPNDVTFTIFSVGDTDGGTSLEVILNQFIPGRVRVAFNHNYSLKWQITANNSVFLSDIESMFTIVHNGVTPVIYKDGVEIPVDIDNATDLSWWLNDSTGLDNIIVGAKNTQNAGLTSFFIGEIRDVKLWDTNLTLQEIETLYVSGPTDVNPPVLSEFTVYSEYPNRIFFNSNEFIVGSNTTGISLSGVSESITGITINQNQKILHYFTLDGNILSGDTLTISGTGADNIQDLKGNQITSFTSISVNYVFGDPYLSEPQMYHDILVTSNGTANLFVREPENINVIPEGGWPLMVYWGGGGTDGGDTTSVTGAAMSTSNGTTYTLAPSILGRLMATSVKIRVNGNIVGSGTFGGTISGSGITSGSFSTTSGTPTISVTFGSNQSGNTVTVDYIHSTMFIEGSPLYVNGGDTLDETCIWIAIQNEGTTTIPVSYFHNVVSYAYLKYKINLNRLHHTGLSFGGLSFSIASQFEQLYKFWIKTSGTSLGKISISDPADVNYTETGCASTSWATATMTGTYTNVANYKTGIALVHSTGDGTVAYGGNILAQTWGAQTLKNYPYIYSPVGNLHNTTLWHTNFYNRKYRTDASGTAPWDYVDFALRYSLDDLESAELAMQQAEKRRQNSWRDWDDWKFAALKISQLGASAEKTALEGRLSTLRTAIGGTIWIITHSTAAVNNPDYYDINTMTNHADNQTLSNLIDVDGITHTGISIGTGDNTRTGTYQGVISNSSGINNAGNFPTTMNNAGAVINFLGGGTLPMTTSGFATGTYAIRIYLNARVACTFSTIVNGVTKEIDGANNSLLGYIEYDGLTAAQIANYTVNMIDSSSIQYYMTNTEIIKYA